MQNCSLVRYVLVLCLILSSIVPYPALAGLPIQGRLADQLNQGRALGCGAGLATTGAQASAEPTIQAGDLTVRLLKQTDYAAAAKILTAPKAEGENRDVLSADQVRDLITVGSQRHDHFPKNGLFALGVFRGRELLATAQLMHTDFTPPKKPGEPATPETEIWAELGYQMSPDLGPLSKERESLATQIVKAVTRYAFVNLRVGGLHAQTTLTRKELLDFASLNGLKDTVAQIDANLIPEVMSFQFAMSRLEYETSDDVLGAVPIPGVIPPLQFSDTVNDAITLQAIHAIQDRDAREKARLDYYPAPEPRWHRWMAAGGLLISAWFGIELGLNFAENPSWLTALAAVPAIIMGIFTADYLNSEFHWGLDNTFYNSKLPILRGLARDARIHHEDPQACLRKTYLGRLSEVAPVAIPGFLLTAALMSSGIVTDGVDSAMQMLGYAKTGLGHAVNFTLATFLGSMAMAGFHSTMTHQMAHDPRPPWIWRMLQKLRISIPQKMHMTHHQPPYDQIYSVQTGWIDWFHSREYWHKRMRRYYESTGKMPGTWIQDPRAIPADIVEKLRAEYEKNVNAIPMELWTYAPRAYPRRVPADLKGPLEFVQQRWRSDFILRRQREYQYAAKVNLAWAQEKWIEEQKAFPWIYGPTPQPLDLEL